MDCGSEVCLARYVNFRISERYLGFYSCLILILCIISFDIVYEFCSRRGS